MGTDLFERRVVISGVGQSVIGRQVDRSGLALTIDAILAAVEDAGLRAGHVPGRRRGEPARLREREPV